MGKEIKRIIKNFKENFSDDFVMKEAEIWLESEMEELIKKFIPQKISNNRINKAIKAWIVVDTENYPILLKSKRENCIGSYWGLAIFQTKKEGTEYKKDFQGSYPAKWEVKKLKLEF